MTTGSSNFASSGSSPPLHGIETPPLPPDLVDTLATLLAQAIVADIRQFPNLAELHVNFELTVESPSGRNRRRSPRQRQLSTQAG